MRIDEFDSRLLDRIQLGVPLVREPFAQLARELGCDEPRVMAHLSRLGGPEGIVREISGIFDAASLGYRLSLVAFELANERLDTAGEIVAAHPGVSHCYARSGRYNLWFTLAVSPVSKLGLEGTVGILADRCRARRRLILPALRRYKLNVFLSPALDRRQHARFPSPASSDRPYQPYDISPPRLTEEQAPRNRSARSARCK